MLLHLQDDYKVDCTLLISNPTVIQEGINSFNSLLLRN